MQKPHITIQTALFVSYNTSVSNSVTAMLCGQFNSEEEEEEDEDENHAPGVLREEFILSL
jgi:hypothetical protein